MSRRPKTNGISATEFMATFSACGPRDRAPRAVAPVITADTATLQLMHRELVSRMTDSTRCDDLGDLTKQLQEIECELDARHRDAEFAKTVARTR